MKEVTRIHLAKVPYDIEIDAKKLLESYLNELAKYAASKEVVDDIEIRMTELLSEHGVTSGGVISLADVAALREQLGEPEAFIDEEAMMPDERAPKKLYRDVDNAILGGVASGLAAYFRIDTWLARLIFIILLTLSYGTAAIVYLIMWILMPPARTVAEKLQMRGEPVTLAAIKSASLQGDDISSRRSQSLRRAVFGIIAAGLTVIGAGVLAFTGVMVARLLVDDSQFGADMDTVSLRMTVALAAFAGVMLAILFGVAARAVLRRKITKKSLIGAAVIIALGLTSFGLAVSGAIFQDYQRIQKINDATTMTQLSLPDEFENISKLRINASGAAVQYSASDEVSMTKVSLPGVTVRHEVKGDTAEVWVEYAGSYKHDYGFEPTVMINGPKIENIAIESGKLTYSTDSQPKLDVVVAESAGGHINNPDIFTLQQGSVDNLTLDLSKTKAVSANAAYASVKRADINFGLGSQVVLGNISELSVKHPQACPASDYISEVPMLTVASVSGGEAEVNGQHVSLKKYSSPCLSISIGDEIDD